MTIDRTLKVSGGMLRTRSVLTRAERIEFLKEEGKFDPEADSVLGLPKVRIRHSKAGSKSKKVEEVQAEVAEGTAGTGKTKE
jgi:small basic protein (TIGR04137 family)